jgi:hypothetical protein
MSAVHTGSVGPINPTPAFSRGSFVPQPNLPARIFLLRLLTKDDWAAEAVGRSRSTADCGSGQECNTLGVRAIQMRAWSLVVGHDLSGSPNSSWIAIDARGRSASGHWPPPLSASRNLHSAIKPEIWLFAQTVDDSGSYGRVTAKDFLLLPATDRPSRHPGAPFGHGNASARRQRSGHSRLAPPRPRMPWRTKVYSMMAPQGGLAPGAAGGCRGWAETQSASSFSAVARQGAELGRLGQPTSPK